MEGRRREAGREGRRGMKGEREGGIGRVVGREGGCRERKRKREITEDHRKGGGRD